MKKRSASSSSGKKARVKKAKVPSARKPAVPALNPTTVEKLSSGVPIGGNQGDSLCDVISYWSHVCSHPAFLFNVTAMDWSEKIVLDSGAIQIYSNFTEYMDGESRKNQAIEKKLSDEGLDLQDQEGVNIEDLDPQPQPPKPASAENESKNESAPIRTKVDTNVRQAR